MRIAIEARFHSLVEVLLQNGIAASPRALVCALRHRNPDLVQLLLQFGADPKSVPFDEVVMAGRPELVRLFIERGADILTDHPIAKGLIHATRPFLGVYRTYRQSIPELQFQADMALRHFCEEDSERGVALLMWVGANPRAKVPRKPGESEDWWTTAIDVAAFRGRLKIIKLMKPDSAKDSLNDLLASSIFNMKIDVVQHWIDLGADVNGADNSGVSLHTRVWHQLEWRLTDHDRSWRGTDAKRFVCDWFSLGAKWAPVTEDVRSFRRCMKMISTMEAYEIIKLLCRKEVLPPDRLAELLDTKDLRLHLHTRRAAITGYVPRLAKWLTGNRKPSSARSTFTAWRTSPPNGALRR